MWKKIQKAPKMGTCSKLQTVATEHRSTGAEAKWREAKCEYFIFMLYTQVKHKQLKKQNHDAPL